MLTGVGASTWASGNQECSGHDGQLHREADEEQGEDQVLKRRRADRLGLQPREGFRPVHARGEEWHDVAVGGRFARFRLHAEPLFLSRQHEHYGPTGFRERAEIEGVDGGPFEGFVLWQRRADPFHVGDPLGDERLVREITDVRRGQGDHRREQADRSGEGVNDEFHGRVLAALPAPEADEEVHRHEHQFVEDVEEEEIEGEKRPGHAGLEKQEQRQEAARAIFDFPTRDDSGKSHKRGQDDERQADAVHAQGIFDSERLHPRSADDEVRAQIRPLIGRIRDLLFDPGVEHRGGVVQRTEAPVGANVENAVVVIDDGTEAHGELRRGREGREPAHALLPLRRKEEEHHGGDGGKEDERGQKQQVDFPVARVEEFRNRIRHRRSSPAKRKETNHKDTEAQRKIKRIFFSVLLCLYG